MLSVLSYKVYVLVDYTQAFCVIIHNVCISGLRRLFLVLFISPALKKNFISKKEREFLWEHFRDFFLKSIECNWGGESAELHPI